MRRRSQRGAKRHEGDREGRRRTHRPLLCSIEAGTAIIGRSKRFIIDAIARGQLQAVKSDRRTLLVVQSLKDYVAGLPPAKGTKNPRRHVV
jgi:hypothetical protein